MSRPTVASQHQQAEQWMTHMFGSGMRDYVTQTLHDPISVAVVEVDRVIKLSGARRMLENWRSEDTKTAAGRKAIFDATAALSLILLQLRLG